MLDAPAPVSEAAVTLGGRQASAGARRCGAASRRGGAARRGRFPPASSENAFAATPDMGIPMPRPRPEN